MGQRKTRKAGIPQSRHQDPKVQRTFDAVIERLEVLDGLRGDQLDKAVTYRDLALDGFTIVTGSGGSPQITNTPGPGGGADGDGPGVGPAAAPTNLSVTETFLALLATWQNPSFNLQHIEVWRSLTDDLTAAQMIGTTVSPYFMDYVGASRTFYYWVRAVGTDGTFSAYNSVSGTIGTTGIDPSDFEFQMNISASNLDAALAARIDLIDVDGLQDSLMTRVAAAEGDIVAIDSRTTSLEASTTGLATTVGGHTTSIDANATLIATQQTSITQLLSDLGVAEGDIASNAAAITVNASDILNLQASIGALDAEGGQTWEFLTNLDGFTGSNATVAWSGAGTGLLRFTPTGADSKLISPAISLTGGIFTQVVVRLRQTVGGGTWDGSVTYTTPGHTASSSFIKTIPDPALALGQWTTLTWDMSALTTGGADWESSEITGITLDLVSDAFGEFEIDWIIIAKFSTTAFSDALSALDVRVTASEGGIAAQATQITALESTVNNPTTGVAANSTAVLALTTDVTTNQNNIAANAAAITALQSTVNNPTTGVVVTASAVSVLETDVSTIDGVLVAQASDLTQLVARISGGYASVVNPLTSLAEGFGSSYLDAEVQSFSDVGGRSGVAARIDTSSNVSDTVQRADGTRIVVDPNAIYEVKFSVYHNRPTDAGSFYAGLSAYTAAAGGAVQDVRAVNDRVAGTLNSNPYWLRFSGANHDEEWLDVTCYILGSNVAASSCPNMIINGSSATTGYGIFNDGWQIVSAPYVELRFLNYNGSPAYGDDTVTTTYVTNLQVHRIDSAAANYAAIQTEATVTANTVGDLNALYAVKVELNAGGVPYVSGFGLAADVIDGIATSAFGVRADQFFIVSPTNTSDDIVPFSVGLVQGSATVGINGQLIVDGTIRGTSIVAGDITADQITVASLSAFTTDTGTLRVSRLTTDHNGTAPLYLDQTAFRVEIQDAAATTWPLWYGSGAKSAAGRFYVDNFGNVTVKGLLDAGMIKQSFFAPAGGNQSFRVACDYPANYAGGVYTGKAAHLNPVLTTGYNSPEGSVGVEVYDRTNFNATTNLTQHRTGYHTPVLTLISPTNTGSVEYGRLGSLSENVLIRYSTTFQHAFGPPYDFWLIVKYKYDAEVERFAYIQHMHFEASMRTGSLVAEDIFVTRSTAWSTLQIRLGVGCRRSDENSGTVVRGTISSANLTLTTMNMGYADQAGIVVTTSPTDGATVPLRDQTILREYR